MTVPATQLPRLLAGLVCGGPLELDVHEFVHGPLPPIAPLGRLEHSLIAELELSGLRGMGGGSFPLATKISAVAAQAGKPVVLVNGAEGEPLSRKDRLLLSRLPQLVLDGAIVTARLLGSLEIVVAFDGGAPALGRILEHAVAQRPELGVRRGLAARVAPAPSGYIVGQESALINALDGREPKPSVTPPYPFERGLGRRPTLVGNAETFAQLALVARHGADWYRSIGTGSAPGSRLVTVGGAVAEPGVVEIAGGTSLRALLQAAGGPSQPLQAVLLGGYGGAWTTLDGLTLELDELALRGHGLTLGPGIAYALPQSACPVTEVAHVTRWLEQSSAHQCGPCVHGLAAIAGALEELCRPGRHAASQGRIERWCAMVTGRGACSNPDGAARFVSSALQVFRANFDAHAREGRCEHCDGHAWLPVRGRAQSVAA